MKTTDVKNIYREAAIRSASQVGLVVMMYDMLIEDLRRTIEAIRSNDVEQRTTEIKHAFLILEQLQGTLNMEKGCVAAKALDSFYSMIRAKLLEAHLKCSEKILVRQIDLLADIRQAWQQSEKRAMDLKNAPQVAALTSRIANESLVAGSCDYSA